MGWWESDSGVWGDEAADMMGDTLEKICAVFLRDWGRAPTESELHDGVSFSLPNNVVTIQSQVSGQVGVEG